jgi:hypothetical protein
MGYLDFLTAEVVALFLQSLLYGCNIISLYHAVRALIIRSDRARPFKDINKQMLAIAIILAGFGTVNVAFFLREVISYMQYINGASIPGIIGNDSLAFYPLTPLLVVNFLTICAQES